MLASLLQVLYIDSKFIKNLKKQKLIVWLQNRFTFVSLFSIIHIIF